jgi:hypothetical protein
MSVESVLRSHLESILERARLGRLTYRMFFETVVYALNPSVKIQNIVREDIVEDVRELIKMVERAQDNLSGMRLYVEHLINNGYKSIIVDCLGLPEIYEIYVKAREECRSWRSLAVSIKPYINRSARTQRFKDAYRAPSMTKLAHNTGSSLHRYIDIKIHSEFSEPLEVNILLDKVDAKIKAIAEDIAKDAARSGKAFIISDHGYDIYCTDQGTCYIEHGINSKLAKLAPLIIIDC